MLSGSRVVILMMVLWHGEKDLELDEIEEEVLVGIPGCGRQYLDKALEDHILFLYLRGWNLFLCFGIILISLSILIIGFVG